MKNWIKIIIKVCMILSHSAIGILPLIVFTNSLWFNNLDRWSKIGILVMVGWFAIDRIFEIDFKSLNKPRR